ncbi:hypothetical protein Hanom_Chr07g00667411 [Helianthus anomalus]
MHRATHQKSPHSTARRGAGLNKWYAKAFEGVVFMAGSKVRRWFDHEEEHRMDLQVRLILLAIN